MASDVTTDAKPKPKSELTDEEFFDEHIAPLLSQLIDLCESRGIPMLAGFNLLSLSPETLEGTVALNEHNAAIAVGKYLPDGYGGPLLLAFALMTGKGRAIVGNPSDVQEELAQMIAQSAKASEKKKATVH